MNLLRSSDAHFGGFRQTLDAEMKRLHKDWERSQSKRNT